MTTENNTPLASLIEEGNGVIIFARDATPDVNHVECQRCDIHITTTKDTELALRLAENHRCSTSPSSGR